MSTRIFVIIYKNEGHSNTMEKARKQIDDILRKEIQYVIDFYEFVSRSLGIQKPIRGKFE